MLDSSSIASINVYSPKKPCSEAYLTLNLSGLIKLRNQLNVILNNVDLHNIYFEQNFITVSDSNGSIYKLVIVFDENIRINNNPPYTEDLVNETANLTCNHYDKVYTYADRLDDIKFEIKEEWKS